MDIKELSNETIYSEIKDKTDKELLTDCTLHLAYGLDDVSTYIRQELIELLCRFNNCMIREIMYEHNNIELDKYKNAFKELIDDQNRIFNELYKEGHLLFIEDNVKANHELTDWLIRTYGDKN